RAPSPAHSTTRSNPHGVYKHNRNTQLEQPLCLALGAFGRSLSQGVGLGAPFFFGCGVTNMTDHTRQRVDCFLLPALSHIRCPCPPLFSSEAPTPHPCLAPPHGEEHRPRSWRRPPPAASEPRHSTSASEARHMRGLRRDAARSQIAETSAWP